MRLFRIVSVSALSVAFCLLLAWATMVIVHAGEEKTSAVEQDPAAAGVPASAEADAFAAEAPAAGVAPPSPSAVQPGFNVEDTQSIDVEFAPDFVPRPGRFSGSSRRRTASSPLKDVTDLGKATANQLQAGDRFLESQTRRLAEQYAKAKDAEARAKLRDELAKTIERHFDVRHQVRKQEIDQLEARVRKLREHLQKREAARAAIVEMRLKQFISAAEGLGWDADFGRTRSPFSAPGGFPGRPTALPPDTPTTRPTTP